MEGVGWLDNVIMEGVKDGRKERRWGKGNGRGNGKEKKRNREIGEKEERNRKGRLGDEEVWKRKRKMGWESGRDANALGEQCYPVRGSGKIEGAQLSGRWAIYRFGSISPH